MKKDTYKYKGWLNSDFFWKRSLAVYGHAFCTVLIVWTAILIFIGITGDL